jgi:CheY-like chemotaxis protein
VNPQVSRSEPKASEDQKVGSRSEPKASEDRKVGSRSEPKASEDQSGEPQPVVLLVDDEPRILSALLRALRREGYQLITAETPDQALLLAEQHAIDCVLSDHKMPGMTGLELLERIARRHPRAARLLITGWNTEIDPAALTRIGVATVLPKPWDDAELKRALRSALGAADVSPS